MTPAQPYRAVPTRGVHRTDARPAPWSRLAMGLLALAATLPAVAQDTEVLLSTSAGDIVLRLDAEHAPKTVENFLKYVRAGHYDGTVFHRVIPGFMVQGGGFTPALKEKATRAPIRLETGAGLSNLRGTVAMARTAVPDSATAQFFINLVDNQALDPAHADDGRGYAVFGTVTAGMEVVDAIAQAPTGSRGGQDDVPLRAIVIQHASVAR